MAVPMSARAMETCLKIIKKKKKKKRAIVVVRLLCLVLEFIYSWSLELW